MRIIDRRQELGGKSLPNRQRFLRRAREAVRGAVDEAVRQRSITDIDRGGDVTVTDGGVREPTLRPADVGGLRHVVLPGNKTFVVGDRLPRRKGGRGAGSGAGTGESEDSFQFYLAEDEFLDLFLEDLELPDIAKRQLVGIESEEPQRAGFKTTGPPSALSVPRTMRNSLARRIALARPFANRVDMLTATLTALEEERAPQPEIEAAAAALARAQTRLRLVPFLDPIDLRYRRFEPVPRPIARAVMFCLMDVSASMDESMKDLAKRFFALLYLFLSRKYERVEVVFIRHTNVAEEVDEHTFFYDKQSGGTAVSSALAEMARIVDKRYPPSEWNLYVAQASDGDNSYDDNLKTTALLTSRILPIVQYYAYVEVLSGSFRDVASDRSMLWAALEHIAGDRPALAMKQIRERRDVYPVFRELFERREGAAR